MPLLAPLFPRGPIDVRRWLRPLPSDGSIPDMPQWRWLHTPGHSHGAVCFHLAGQGWLFSGDTLFAGGPGATGRSFSDFGTIIDSIRDRMLVLDPDTVVHTGHGSDTTIGAERPHLQEWIARGH